MLDLNKIFPWLSIRSKLIIAFGGLSVLPVLLVGLYGINSNTKMMKEVAVKDLTHDLSMVRNRTANFMTDIAGDMRVLENSFLTHRILAELSTQSHLAEPATVRLLNQELLSLARTRGIYYQIRIVDQFGNELVRVESRSPDAASKSFEIVDAASLRHTPEEYYLLLVDSLSKGQFAIAPAELAAGNDKMVPVMSFAMPLYFHGKKEAILIADIFAQDFFSALGTYRSLKSGEVVVVVSGDGHYLYHSKEKKNWNALLAARDKYNLYHDYGAATRQALLSPAAGTFTTRSGDIISHSPLFPPDTPDYDAASNAAFTMPLFIFDAVPKAVIMAPVHSYALKFSGLLVLILITATGLSIVATHQFTEPIADLQQGADIIAKGNYSHRVTVDTRDEIEDLAERFNQMASSLNERDKEIHRYRTHLEETVESRTSELSEEKSKLQAILDNVPSAFLLLDRSLRIQTTSSAFARITGYSPDEVRGKDCSKIFGTNGICEECICQQALQYGRVESRVTQRSEGKRKEKYIEHIAIPMKQNGEVQAVLAVMTDITKRKQLEQRLVQTEKLVAAGEIAALIAHEFRNSLTSIKMILQLLKESNGLSRSEKKSLGVALNSAGDMEGVVSELLNYARPVPMEFKMERLEKIVNESLAFLDLRFEKAGIRVEKAIEASLPPMSLDVLHLREAIINILVNAIQAVDQKRKTITTDPSIEEEAGVISVTLRKTVLSKTLHDYPSAEIDEYPNTEVLGQDGREIVLKRGASCLTLEISDSGIGIERNNITRVFDPFFTTKTNGTGLGLSMVKRTVNSHGGIITVESHKGKGTTFRIYFPSWSESRKPTPKREA